MRRLASPFHFLNRDRRGSVSVIVALMLPMLVGIAGFVAEYGNGVLAKAQDQRVADLAAYAGATAYNATSSSTSMTSVIDNVAALNGVGSTHVTGVLVSSPTGDGNQAVEVTVNTTVPLVLSRLIGTGTTIAVKSVAYAEMKANSQGCIVALSSSGTGVTLSGAAGITADACAVDSNSTVTVPCASSMTTIAVDYDSGSAPSEPCSGITGPGGTTAKILKVATVDPLAGNSEVTDATARLSTVGALTSPAAPVETAAGSISFGPTASTTATQCTADSVTCTLSGSTWTVTCSGTTKHFGSITVTSSTVNFAGCGTSATTYDFSGGISVSSSASLTFGPGTFNIAQGVSTASASSITFGAGTFWIGPNTSGCTDGGMYSVCVASATTATFGGPSTFTLSAGVYAGSIGKVYLGSGSTNSFDIGESSNGYALYAGSSSTAVFADATGGSDVFELVGTLDATSASCVTIGDAAEHDINGAIIAASASSTTLGSGIYTVNNYLDFESASGSSGCGTSAGSGTGVTFVIGGNATPGSGSCSGLAVCVLSASGTSVVAPTTGPTAGLAVIGPISPSNHAGATFSSASSGAFSGAVYIPNGAITISSASSLGGGSGDCLELIGSQVTVSSASAVGSTCISGASSSSNVMLVE